MGLVDDDDLIVAQELVPRELGEEDSVGHHLDAGLVGDLRREADLIADRAAEVFAEFVGDAFGDGACGDAPWPRVSDHPLDAEAELEADLRRRRRLARTGLTGDDDDLVVADRLGDLILSRTDWRLRRVGDGDGVGRAGLAQARAALTVLSAGATPSAAALLRPAAADPPLPRGGVRSPCARSPDREGICFAWALPSSRLPSHLPVYRPPGTPRRGR